MSGIRTRAALKTLITTNITDGASSVSPTDVRGVDNSTADSAVFLGEAETVVISMTLTAPPGSETDRDAYVVAATATGTWAGKEDNIAVWDATLSPAAYIFIPPADGMAVWNLAGDAVNRYDAGLSPAAWAATAAGVTSPSRTTMTLSGLTTSQAIPAGVTWFRFISEELTLNTGTADLAARLYHTSDTVRRDFNSLVDQIGSSAAVQIVTTNGAIAWTGTASSATSRGIAGTVYSPRDATKKTMADGRAYNPTANEVRHREGAATAAGDDDTLRVDVSAGTVTGTVHIEWFYV